MTWVMSICRTRVPLADVIVTHQDQDTRWLTLRPKP